MEEGDFLCIRTGFDRVLLGYGKSPPPGVQHAVCAGLDGSDPRLLEWITDSGVVALISDNEAVEFLPAVNPPAGRGAHFPLHEHCLFKLGVPLGELFLLSDLADWLRAERELRLDLAAEPPENGAA